MSLAFCIPAQPLIGCFKGPSTLLPLTLIQCSRHCCMYTNHSNATSVGAYLSTELDHLLICARYYPQVMEGQRIIIIGKEKK